MKIVSSFKKIIIILIILFIISILFFKLIKPKLLITNEYSLNTSINEEYYGLKIVYFHTINDNIIDKIINEINNIQPDIVIYNGKENIDKLNIKSNIGNYVISNSEINNTNFKVLNNKCDDIYYKSNIPIHICGLTSNEELEYSNNYTILVTNNNLIDNIDLNRFNLVLANSNNKIYTYNNSKLYTTNSILGINYINFYRIK